MEAFSSLRVSETFLGVAAKDRLCYGSARGPATGFYEHVALFGTWEKPVDEKVYNESTQINLRVQGFSFTAPQEVSWPEFYAQKQRACTLSRSDAPPFENFRHRHGKSAGGHGGTSYKPDFKPHRGISWTRSAILGRILNGNTPDQTWGGRRAMGARWTAAQILLAAQIRALISPTQSHNRRSELFTMLLSESSNGSGPDLKIVNHGRFGSDIPDLNPNQYRSWSDQTCWNKEINARAGRDNADASKQKEKGARTEPNLDLRHQSKQVDPE